MWKLNWIDIKVINTPAVPNLERDELNIQNSSSDSKLCAHFSPLCCLLIFWDCGCASQKLFMAMSQGHWRDPIRMSFILKHAFYLRVLPIRPITNLGGEFSRHPFAAASPSARQEYCVELFRSWFITCTTDRGSCAAYSSLPLNTQ